MPEPIQQADAIPFRRRGDAIEFCLITSISGRRWGFPKGIIEGDDTPQATVLNEALEEAGLHGRIIGEPIGVYRYQKWGTDLDVVVYLMEVTKMESQWQESDLREREWVTPEKALAQIDRPEISAILENAIAQIQP